MPHFNSLTVVQTAALISYLRTRSTKAPARFRLKRDEVLILLMLEAGLRVSEAIELPYSAAYWEGKPRPVIEIPNDLAKYDVGGQIPTTAALKEALADFIPAESSFAAFNLQVPIVDMYTTPRHLSRRQAARIVETVCNAALGIHVHPHTLRHTFGNTMRKYTDLPTLQTLMRHKHLASTQVYMHPTIEDASTATAALDRARGSGKP